MLKSIFPVLLAVALVMSGCVKHLEDKGASDQSFGPLAFPCCVLDKHDGRVIHVEFEHRSNRLVSLSEDGIDRSTLIFWHAGSGGMIDSFTNVNNADGDVEFSRHGNVIGLGSRTLFLLDSGSYRQIRTFEAEAYEYQKIIDLEFGGFETPIAASKRYTVETRFRGVTALSFSPDVRYVASGHENGQVKVWEIKTGDLLKIIWATKVFGGIMDVEFSPDGRFIVACQDDERLRVWRFPDYREQFLVGHERAVYTIAFNYVTGHLASAGVEGKVLIWDVETGESLGELEAHEKAIMSVAITEDGKTLFTGSKDNTIGIWDLDSGRQIEILHGHEKQVNSVAVNSNATLLASGSDDGSVRIWDISSLGLCNNITLTPEPLYPAKLDGQVWFEDSSGDGILSPGENGKFMITISNVGEGTAFNIVTMAIPDTLIPGMEIEPPGVVPILLPGRTIETTVMVSNTGETELADIVFTFRVLESNGFHISPPLKASIVRISPE